MVMTETLQAYEGPGVWDSNTEPRFFNYDLSMGAKKEVANYINSLQGYATPEKLEIEKNNLPFFSEEIEKIRTEVENGKRMVLIPPIEGINLERQLALNWTISNLLGEPLVQKANGEILVRVYDRHIGKKMAEGTRYHQGRQGGSIHTDNVNLSEPWEYMVLSFVSPAAVYGGESILFSGMSVFNRLLSQHPNELETLTEPFYFERRGIDAENTIYPAPIITFNQKGEPEFRHLPDYTISAHERMAEKNNTEPFTPEQKKAFDTLNEILDNPNLQLRCSFQPGWTAVLNDCQILHGRTEFKDDPKSITIDEYMQNPNPRKTVRRTLGRTWVKKK
jgi:alpha-ketoglutarate-dependent taurine dioxygenase